MRGSLTLTISERWKQKMLKDSDYRTLQTKTRLRGRVVRDICHRQNCNDGEKLPSAVHFVNTL